MLHVLPVLVMSLLPPCQSPMAWQVSSVPQVFQLPVSDASPLRGLNSEAPRLLPVCDVNVMSVLCQSCLRAMPPLP